MIKEICNKCLHIIVHPKKHVKLILTVIMVLLIPGVYGLVYITGGIKFVYAHSMYIPIVSLAILYETKGGLLSGLIGGLLLGPLMVINTQTGEEQDLLNWVFRLVLFMIIGGTVGVFVSQLRKQVEKVKTMALYNPDTSWPLFTSINTTLSDSGYLNQFQDTVYVIAISNSSDIIELLGKNFYNTLLTTLYDVLLNKFNQEIDLYQNDFSRLTVLVKKSFSGDFEEDMMKCFDTSFNVHGIPVYLSIKLGVSSSKGMLFDRVEEAILATNIAKRKHQQVSTFSQAALPNTKDIELLGQFRDALEQGQLYLVYQPVHQSTTDKIVAVEALIRWNHPSQGTLQPAAFIHLIENTQLINFLSEFVIKESVKMLDKLDKSISIAVNISGNNFYSNFFINNMIEYLSNNKVDGSRLVFEITETILMENPKKSIDIMNKFIDQGIQFAIDDFGTGYSSLSYITLFPVKYLKIDRMFIKEIDKEKVKTIIDSTINLSHNLGIEVIAEGVEKDEDIMTLRESSCDYIQGFSKSIPLQVDSLISYIAKQQKKNH